MNIRLPGLRLRRAAPAVALLLALAAPAPAVAGVFDPARFTLDNGLEVVVVTDRRAPVVSHMLWYKVGAADEPPGKSGIAHFLEHLMFKGTDKLGPGEASRLIARIGGEEGAFTSHDYTAFHQTVAPDRLETVMEIEADRMANLRLSPEEVAAERDVILEERRTRTDNSDAARLYEQVGAAMFLAYPYRVPVIGWASEIERLGLEDAIAFYRRWYGPDNAILVVAGDIGAEEALALAKKHYGPVPRRGVAPRARVEEPPQIAPRRLSMESAQAGQARWSRRYLAPSHAWGRSELAYPLEALAEILGGGTTSRLYRALVVEGGIAVSAGCWYGPGRLGPSSFGFYGSPAQGRTVAEVEAAIDAEIARVLADGVTQAELDAAKTRLQRSAIFARDSVTAPARIVGAALASGRSLEEIEAWPERIVAVTAADVAEAAREAFRLERSVTVALLPEVAP